MPDKAVNSYDIQTPDAPKPTIFTIDPANASPRIAKAAVIDKARYERVLFLGDITDMAERKYVSDAGENELLTGKATVRPR